MDHKQRAKSSQQQDPVLAAQIVRNIAAIERDYHLASGPLSERMMQEAVKTMGKATTAPWMTIDTDLSAILVHPDWRMTRGVGNGDAWIELAEITSVDDREYSWLAAAARAGETQLGLELTFRRGLMDYAEDLLGDAKAVAGLLKQGFVRDAQNERLFLPIDIPAEALAQGFEQNDLAEAVAPVGRAVTQAIASKADLDAVINQVREAAKRK